MARNYEVAVIGLGIMGAAATAMIAADGRSVIGIDRYVPPHDRGSSHGETRLLRVAYAEGAAYVPLAQRSAQLWNSIGSAAGRSLFHQCGIVYAGDPDTELLSGVRHSAGSHHLKLEIRDRPPPASAEMVIDDGWQVLIEPGAGYLLAEPCHEALLAMAGRAGADLRTGKDARFVQDEEGFRVSVDGEYYRAAKLIVCAGAWLPQLLPGVAAGLWPERRTAHWFEASPDFTPEAGFRPFVVALDDHCWIYGFPAVDGKTVKAANHFGGERLSSPQGIDHPVTPADTGPVEEALKRIFPGLGKRIRSKNCLYTMTPDGHFLIGEPPSIPNLLVVGGMSGHGFKFAPGIGEWAAQWARGDGLPGEAGMFSPARADFVPDRS